MMFVLMNVFATSRGYSSLLEYYRIVRLDVPLQMDIMCPLYQREDALRVFGEQLGRAIRTYLEPTRIAGDHMESTRIARFRLLLTRYSSEAQDPETLQSLQKEMSALTAIPPDDIVFVKAPPKAVFERAAAVNLLQRNACRKQQCLVARVDADMTVYADNHCFHFPWTGN